jgi:hypothetical protein
MPLVSAVSGSVISVEAKITTNDFRPIQRKSNTPLSGGARMARGFRRIGLVITGVIERMGRF